LEEELRRKLTLQEVYNIEFDEDKEEKSEEE